MPLNNGLNTDAHPRLQPEGSWRYMRNGVINRSLGRIENEQGTESIDVLDGGYFPIGSILLNDNGVILFVVHPSLGSEIVLFKDGVVDVLVSDLTWTNKLQFPSSGYIQGEFRINSKLERIIYWTDNVNPPRYLNIDTLNANPNTIISLESMQLFPELQAIATFELDSVNIQGGALKTGIYQFAVSYMSPDGTQTNFFLVSNPISINDDVNELSSNAFDGAVNDIQTSKSITFTLGNLDSNYDLIRVAVIKDKVLVSIIPDIIIPATTNTVTYTFTGTETLIDSSLDAVIINTATYLTARTMKQQEGVLYLGNLTRKEDIGFQKYANGIRVVLDEHPLGLPFLSTETANSQETNGYKNPLRSFNIRGYRRDEVYAFYISFLLKDGTESKAYHIPGRPPVGDGGVNGKASGSIVVNSGAGSAIHPSSAFIEISDFPATVPLQGTFASGGGYEYNLPATLGDTYVVEASIPAAGVAPQYDSGSVTILSTDSPIVAFQRIRDKLDLVGASTHWTITVDSSGMSGQPKIFLTSKVKGSAYNGINIYVSDVASGIATDTYFDKIIQALPTTGGINDNANLPQDSILIESPTNPDISVLMPAPFGGQAKLSLMETYRDALNANVLFAAEYIASINSADPTQLVVTAINVSTTYNGQNLVLTVNSGLSFTQSSDVTAGGRENDNDSFGFGVELLIDSEGDSIVILTTANISGFESALSIAQKIYAALIANGTLTARYVFNLLGSTITITAIAFGESSNGIVAVGDIDEAGLTFVTTGLTGGSTAEAIIETSAVNGTTVGSAALNTEIGAFPDQKFFHFNSAVEPTTRMAYWENNDEIYPADDESEIWTVNGSGVGITTGSTLANRKVRHHHFPDFAESPHYDGEDNDNTAIALGFHLENVVIPNDIKEQVLGYRVYYAKRTAQNVRILDQSVPTYGQWLFDELLNSQPRMLDSTEHLLFEDKILYHHPFSMMLRTPSIGALSYAKIVCQVNNTADPSDYTHRPDNYEAVAESGVLIDDSVKRIAAKAYLPANTPLVNLTNLGFTRDFDGDFNTSSLITEFATAVDTIDLGSGDRSADSYMWNLMQYKTNLYLSYESQNLVWTGYQQTNLDATVSDQILGGDTFIAFYAWKQHYFASEASILHRAVVESSDNIGYRHEGEEHFEVYFPKSSEEDVINPDTVSPVTDIREYDNYYAYNSFYSEVNDLKPAFPYARGITPETQFPTRVIRSAKDTNNIDAFRIFRENDYIDLPKNRGELVNIESLNNVLILHMERALFRTRGREELVTTDFRAYLGSGDIFAVEPQEMYTTEAGYGGLQHPQSAIVTPFGYFFVDHMARKVFMLSDRLNEVSSLGLREYFKTNLPFSNGGTLRAVWDDDLRRILLTKFDGATGFTLSYQPENNIWISAHDYQPAFYFSDIRNFYSVRGQGFETIYKHNTGIRGQFYGISYPFELEFVDNEPIAVSKRVGNIEIQAAVFNAAGTELPQEPPVHSVRVTNSHQDTGVITTTYFNPTGNIRRTQQTWRLNKLRDSLSQLKRLEDFYHIARIVYNNSDNKLLSIFEVGFGNKHSSKR